MTNAEKIAAVHRILNSTLTVEQKLAAIRHFLCPGPPSQSRPQPTWNPEDDPDVRDPWPNRYGLPQPRSTEPDQ
jgi:hypothetical protein